MGLEPIRMEDRIMRPFLCIERANGPEFSGFFLLTRLFKVQSMCTCEVSGAVKGQAQCSGRTREAGRMKQLSSVENIQRTCTDLCNRTSISMYSAVSCSCIINRQDLHPPPIDLLALRCLNFKTNLFFLS